MRARGCRGKSVGEILRFVSDHPVAEFLDADLVGRLVVIGQHEFGDPEIAAADHAPNVEALLVRLDRAALLDIATCADALAGLRIIKHGILVVDLMLGFEIAGIRSIPVALQRLAHCSIIHLDLLDAGADKLTGPGAPVRNPSAAARYSRARSAAGWNHRGDGGAPRGCGGHAARRSRPGSSARSRRCRGLYASAVPADRSAHRSAGGRRDCPA